MLQMAKLLIWIPLALILYPNTNWAQTEHEAEPAVVAGLDSVQEGQSDTSPVVKSPTGAMLRSIFVPGWGQLYNGKWFKAILVCGVEVGLVANAVYQNQMAVQAVSQLDREWYQDNRNLSIWWLLATVLLSMADAYVDAHLYYFDESPDLSLRIDTLPFGKQKDATLFFSLSIKL